MYLSTAGRIVPFLGAPKLPLSVFRILGVGPRCGSNQEYHISQTRLRRPDEGTVHFGSHHGILIIIEPNTNPYHPTSRPRRRPKKGYPELISALFWVEGVWLGKYDRPHPKAPSSSMIQGPSSFSWDERATGLHATRGIGLWNKGVKMGTPK